jgi:hypothetical protein
MALIADWFARPKFVISVIPLGVGVRVLNFVRGTMGKSAPAKGGAVAPTLGASWMYLQYPP